MSRVFLLRSGIVISLKVLFREWGNTHLADQYTCHEQAMRLNALSKQRSTIRALAARIAELAASPENVRIIQRWRDVNALRKPDRAPVWCRPVGAWAEILPDEALACTDPWLRGIEIELRRILIKHDIGDDSPVEPWFPVDAAFDVDPPNLWGVEVRHQSSGVEGGSWAYDPPLKSEADFDRLRLPSFAYNERETQRRLDRAHDLLGDILPVRLVCDAPLSATLGTAAADLAGRELRSPDKILRQMREERDARLVDLR